MIAPSLPAEAPSIYQPELMEVLEVQQHTRDVKSVRVRFQDEERADRFSFRVGQFGTAATVHERTYHADVAGSALFQELQPRNVVRPDPPVQSDLHDAPRRLRRVQQRSAFHNRVAGRLLDKDVGALLDGRDCIQCMPAVRSS